MFALSVSTSKSTSPFSTRSPSFLCHAMIRPSSIVRPSFGKMTRVMLTRPPLPAGSRDELLRDAHDVVDLRDDALLEVSRIRDRRLEARQAARWRVEIVERLLRHERGDLAAEATPFDGLVHDEQPVRLAHRREHDTFV